MGEEGEERGRRESGGGGGREGGHMYTVHANHTISPHPYTQHAHIVPTSAPQTPTAVVRDSRTIFCSWTPPPADDQNGFIVEYRINVTEVITGLVFTYTSTTTSLEITGLHPDYVYQWTVTAVTIGPGPFTTSATIRTPESSELDSTHMYTHTHSHSLTRAHAWSRSYGAVKSAGSDGKHTIVYCGSHR